jgi:hypothetical protein
MNIAHALQEDDLFFEEVAEDIWLMDNHRWAYWIWESHRDKFNNRKSPVIHIDYHWDAGDDFYHYQEKETEFKSLSLEGVKEIVKEGNWIRFDSFICPAIIRGITDEVHFLCFQQDGDEGIYEGTLARHNAKQFLYKSSAELKYKKFTTQYIFDFCIDVFNRSDMYYEGDIWDDKEIDVFLEDIRLLVKHASLVTFSMSYGYSGTKKDTERLTKYVLHKFLSWRNSAENIA